MKPKTPQAMEQIIAQVRESMPFDLPLAELCDGICQGCSKKLLDYLDMELENWEYRLQQGEIPSLADISKLIKRSKKIYSVLQKNQLV